MKTLFNKRHSDRDTNIFYLTMINSYGPMNKTKFLVMQCAWPGKNWTLQRRISLSVTKSESLDEVGDMALGGPEELTKAVLTFLVFL